MCIRDRSLTAYHRKLAVSYAMNISDWPLTDFVNLSNEHQLTIGIGLPILENINTKISMVIMRPDKPIEVYHKQFLHSDEKHFFTPGHKTIYINVLDTVITPAICYESTLSEHHCIVNENDYDIYLASVAKSKESIERSYQNYSDFAKKYNKMVIMVNAVGNGDNFISAGQSAIWDQSGYCRAGLNAIEESVLLYDTTNHKFIALPVHVNL